MPNINTDFSGRDFTSNFEWLLTLLQQDVPELTDLNHSDAGIALIRLLCRETDQLNYYLDLAFAEGFLLTAKFKQSLIELGKLVDCYPKIAAGASTTLTLTRFNNPDYNQQTILIPRGTNFARSDGINYVYLDDASMPPGTTTLNIDVVQGTYVTMTLGPADFTVVDKNGYPKANLGPNVAAGTVVVTSSNGNTPWTEVESFYRSYSSDLNFRLELYGDDWNGATDTVFLVLGNGTNGAFIPNSLMQVSFVRTDGPSGNTGANTINLPDPQIAITINCNNSTPATGGSLAEDINAYRARLPYVVRTQRRGVTRQDYETLIRSVPGIADCQVVDRNVTPDFPWEYISIYIVPSGGLPTSDLLKGSVLSVLMSSGCLGGWQGRYVLNDAIPVSVQVSVRVNIVQGYSPAAVRSAVNNTILQQFNVVYGTVGGLLDFTNMNVACSRVPGVNWIEFDTPKQDVVMAYGQFPVPGPIAITIQQD